MKRIGWLLLLFATACITTQLTPEGMKVRVTSNPEAVHGCTLIGEVKGADHLNGGIMGQGAAQETAMRELKNRAAAAGANVVLMVTSTTNTSGSVQLGEGYRCTADQLQPPSSH
ncbi:MAG TPA: DUF4156 domain-containing protein [Thermoanaerobaculia bacterium]|nr:DUF4156 domain-containing protein [Thermoanaerobaculia bacterium]